MPMNRGELFAKYSLKRDILEMLLFETFCITGLAWVVMISASLWVT